MARWQRSWPLIGLESAEVRKKKKKKERKKPTGGDGTPVCTPQCFGCGSSDGCGGVCACPANQICDAGTCRACDLTCNEGAINCGNQLQAALNSGGTIYLCPGRYRGNFTMGSTRLIGAGSGDNPATSSILDGGGTGRVHSIAAESTVELTGLRIVGGIVPGEDGGGGVLAEDGDVQMTNCVVTGNYADANGGGILATGGAFRLANSTITHNTAAWGGGLACISAQTCEIINSVITANQTRPGLFAGGGISVIQSLVSVQGTEISRNSASEKGGGINIDSGTLELDATSRVINNTASRSGGIENFTGAVSLNGATISGNSVPQCSNVEGCP